MGESLRQLVVDAEKPGSDNATALQALDLTFSIDLCIEEGGGSVELIQGGRDVEVTSGNIYQYVRKYAHHRIRGKEMSLSRFLGVYYKLPKSDPNAVFLLPNAVLYLLILSGPDSVTTVYFLGNCTKSTGLLCDPEINVVARDGNFYFRKKRHWAQVLLPATVYLILATVY